MLTKKKTIRTRLTYSAKNLLGKSIPFRTSLNNNFVLGTITQVTEYPQDYSADITFEFNEPIYIEDRLLSYGDVADFDTIAYKGWEVKRIHCGFSQPSGMEFIATKDGQDPIVCINYTSVLSTIDAIEGD